MANLGGEPIRCVVRMARHADGYSGVSESGSVFIAGNALELVPPNEPEGAPFRPPRSKQPAQAAAALRS